MAAVLCLLFACSPLLSSMLRLLLPCCLLSPADVILSCLGLQKQPVPGGYNYSTMIDAEKLADVGPFGSDTNQTFVSTNFLANNPE